MFINYYFTFAWAIWHTTFLVTILLFIISLFGMLSVVPSPGRYYMAWNHGLPVHTRISLLHCSLRMYARASMCAYVCVCVLARIAYILELWIFFPFDLNSVTAGVSLLLEPQCQEIQA